MTNRNNSYGQILKATSLFSGVQFLNIVFSIIRSKFAAVLIGSAGIGIVGLLMSALNLISGFTKLGLDVSSVKEIAFAHKNGDEEKVSQTIFTLNRIIWFTGLLGTLITILLSPWLSQLAFGDNSYTFSFIWISIAVLFSQLTVGKLSILQGLRKLRALAKANLLASFISALIVVPFYYFYGIDGIVPVIILSALMSYLIAFYFTRAIKIKTISKSFRASFNDGKSMLKLGATLSLAGLFSLIAAYIMQLFITNEGGLNEVGLYNAAFIIINSYVGLIFNAMGKDYFPRLSGISNDNILSKQIINEQALVAILLLTPIIVLFLIFAPFVVRLLYTKEFLPIIGMVSFGIVGTLFKAVSWSMGYVIIAKGDSKVFIRTAIGFNALLLTLNILAYKYYGLTGIGISFLIYYIIHFIGIRLIIGYKYQFNFEKGFLKIFFICFILCAIALGLTYIDNDLIRTITMTIMIVVSIIFVIHQLNAKLNLKRFLGEILNKKND